MKMLDKPRERDSIMHSIKYWTVLNSIIKKKIKIIKLRPEA